MANFNSIAYISEKDRNYLKNILRKNDYYVYEINGSAIKDIPSFISEIIDILPQDPPLSGSPNLDAFVDSLWGGIDKEGIQKMAILWIDANHIIDNCLEAFKKIIECFEDLSENLLNIGYGLDRPSTLLLFLLGNGEKFQHLELGTII